MIVSPFYYVIKFAEIYKVQNKQSLILDANCYKTVIHLSFTYLIPKSQIIQIFSFVIFEALHWVKIKITKPI